MDQEGLQQFQEPEQSSLVPKEDQDWNKDEDVQGHNYTN